MNCSLENFFYMSCVFNPEFLNADDDEVADNDDSIPCDEETRLLENSGWSSRTRWVSGTWQMPFLVVLMLLVT